MYSVSVVCSQEDKGGSHFNDDNNNDNGGRRGGYNDDDNFGASYGEDNDYGGGAYSPGAVSTCAFLLHTSSIYTSTFHGHAHRLKIHIFIEVLNLHVTDTSVMKEYLYAYPCHALSFWKLWRATCNKQYRPLAIGDQ